MSDVELITSLQRELAEARKIIADAASALTNDGLAGVLAAQFMLLRAPAPSDVKGEEPSASDTNGGGKRLESDTKLTPLTAPSVRGVLVDDGEPTYDTEDSVLYWSAGELMQGIGYAYGSLVKWQPVTLRPASEFGVATRGEPGLKKLPDKVHVWEETGEVRHVTCGEFYMLPDCEDIFHLVALRSTRPCKVMRKLDPALYAIPDGAERTAHDRSSLRVSIERDTARERIKELEAELADWKADTADQLCVNCSDPLEYQERADAEAVKHWSGIVAKKNADAERLRKAIKDAISWLNCSTVSEKSRKILLAALDSPPNAEHQRQGSSQASDQTSTAGGCNEPPSPTAASGSFEAAAEIEANTPITSAPAAESQGNDQHHSEGAKIPEGGSGSSAAESEGGEKEIADSLNALRNVIGYRDEQVDRALRLLASLADQRDALSARLAACEERCRELEAGIVEANRSLLAMPFRSAKENATLEKLGSLLAPKAGGEDAVV